jgi:hypothetical protein
MIQTKTNQVGNYLISEITLGIGDKFITTLKNPLPEQHLNENSMVVSGSISIDIDNYSETVGKGDNAKFKPRQGQTPFEVGTVVTMTALEVCRYICVKNLNGGTLNFETVVYQDALTPAAGVLVVPTGDFLYNGSAKTAGTPILIKQDDIIEAAVGTKIGVFTPS